MNRRDMLGLLALLPAIALADEQEITHAQPELKREKLVIVAHDGAQHAFNVEMAETIAEETIGLMFRQSVAPDGGMLFDWKQPRESQMWMRNTLVPLDMVFINEDGTIRSIAEDTVPESLAVIDSHGPVRATLELAGGTTARLDIRVGDKVLHRIFANAP